MIIIGEKLNSSIPKVQEAFEKEDAQFVQEMAQKQMDCGADYLDVNTGVFTSEETKKMLWVIEQIQKVIPQPALVLDSPDYRVTKEALEQFDLKKVIINSVSLEEERFLHMTDLAVNYHTGIVAMPINAVGIPSTAQERFDNSAALIEKLRASGIEDERIYVDCLIQTLSAEYESGKEVLESIRMIRQAFPKVHIIGGLSNSSFGLPVRGVINSCYLTAAMAMGLDGAIMDITNRQLKLAMQITNMVLGKDEYCMDFITYYKTQYCEDE